MQFLRIAEKTSRKMKNRTLAIPAAALAIIPIRKEPR
jgi:hypothetical protein